MLIGSTEDYTLHKYFTVREIDRPEARARVRICDRVLNNLISIIFHENPSASLEPTYTYGYHALINHAQARVFLHFCA